MGAFLPASGTASEPVAELVVCFCRERGFVIAFKQGQDAGGSEARGGRPTQIKQEKGSSYERIFLDTEWTHWCPL